MTTPGRTLARLGLVALIAFAPACTSERLVFDLAVSATPSPVAGYPFQGERRWDFTVTITNPNGVGVTVDSFHKGVSGTDSGYTLPLIIPRDQDESPVIGRYIPPGQSTSYATNSLSGNHFATGTERRIYHTRGDDGRYYSGEVIVELR